MKNPSRIFLGLSICLFFTAFSTNAKAQSENALAELMIEVPQLDSSRTLDPLKTNLIALGGVQFADYCDSEKLLMLNVDRNIQADDKNILNVLAAAGLSAYVKNDGTIAKAQQNCKDR